MIDYSYLVNRDAKIEPKAGILLTINRQNFMNFKPAKTLIC